MHQNFLAPQKDPCWGWPVSDRRLRVAIKLPPRPDGLRTADALKSRRLSNTWPTRPPGQPQISSFQKYLRATADRILSEHTAPSSGARAHRPHSETPPGEPAIVFLSTGVISCYSSIYFVFERSPRPRRIFYRTLSDV